MIFSSLTLKYCTPSDRRLVPEISEMAPTAVNA
jgi:hypothetical protein